MSRLGDDDLVIGAPVVNLSFVSAPLTMILSGFRAVSFCVSRIGKSFRSHLV